MKRSLSLLLILLSVGSVGALAACSNPSANSTDSNLSNSVETDGSADEVASATNVELNEKQQAYVDEIKAELDTFEQGISDLAAQDPQPQGLQRLQKRYEAAQVTLADLESGERVWSDARKEVNRAMRKLNRLYEKVQAN